MAAELQVTPELENWVRSIARDEFDRRSQGERPGWSVARVQEAMRELEQLRAKIGMPPEEVERIIEAHRREFGRGPLVDDADSHE